MSIFADLPDPNAEVVPIPAEGVDDVLRNIVRDLQYRPGRYRCFGAWWWPIKAMLTRAGLAPQVRGLGSYMDPEAFATLPPADLTPGRVLAEGLHHYQFAARLTPDAVWTDAPNGDRIQIYDPDIEQ